MYLLVFPVTQQTVFVSRYPFLLDTFMPNRLVIVMRTFLQAIMELLIFCIKRIRSVIQKHYLFHTRTYANKTAYISVTISSYRNSFYIIMDKISNFKSIFLFFTRSLFKSIMCSVLYRTASSIIISICRKLSSLLFSFFQCIPSFTLCDCSSSYGSRDGYAGAPGRPHKAV